MISVFKINRIFTDMKINLFFQTLVYIENYWTNFTILYDINQFENKFSIVHVRKRTTIVRTKAVNRTFVVLQKRTGKTFKTITLLPYFLTFLDIILLELL